jgi:hypothetical protein
VPPTKRAPAVPAQPPGHATRATPPPEPPAETAVAEMKGGRGVEDRLAAWIGTT